jgi:hypothetical protein
MEKGKCYKIIIEGDKGTLTFTGVILSMDANFVTFKDREGEILSYNISRVIYVKEVKGGDVQF